MRLIDALGIGSAVCLVLLLLAYIAIFLGDRRRDPEEDCCLAAMTERRYYIHRVRVHGEGQA
jgi:hypothetical protein